MHRAVEQEILAEFARLRAGGEHERWTGAATIDRASYFDPAVAAAEGERVFRQSWLPVCRESELVGAGAFATAEIAGDQVAVLRGADGRLAALHNVCLHRGAVILREPRGRARELRCPYHGFTYDLGGTLRSAPLPQSFDPPIAPGQRALAPVDCDVAWGWAWVKLAGGPPSLADFLGDDLRAELSEWRLEDAVLVERGTRDVDFDWKVGVEAFLESLHVPSIHAETARPLVDHRATAIATLGEHSRMAIAFHLPGAYEADGPMGAAAAAAGVRGFPGLNRVQRSANFSYLVFPSTILNLLPNHLACFRLLPAGPGRARFEHELLAAPAEGSAADAWRESLRPGYARLMQEDFENLGWIQKGVRDASFAGPRLSRAERRIHHFRDRLGRRLDRQTPA